MGTPLDTYPRYPLSKRQALCLFHSSCKIVLGRLLCISLAAPRHVVIFVNHEHLEEESFLSILFIIVVLIAKREHFLCRLRI